MLFPGTAAGHRGFQKRLLKLIVWYDNESGFTHQLLRLAERVGAYL